MDNVNVAKKYSEYSSRFEGDFFGKLRELLGEDAGKYFCLQQFLGNPYQESREEHINILREFHKIDIGNGISDIVSRVYPHTEWVAEEINSKIKGEKIIDIGCGSGLLTVFYAINNPTAQFTGIDVSEDAIRAAEERTAKYSLKNIRWVCGDCLGSSMQKEFEHTDTVILQDSLYQIFGSQDQQKELKMLSILGLRQKEGSIVIIAQDGDGLKIKSQHATEAGYILDDYKKQILFDENALADIAYEIAIFRKSAPQPKS